MPEIHTDTVAEVILLAREMSESASVGAEDGVSGRPGSGVAEREFREFVAGLTEDEKLDLVVLYWIGRDSFSADEYEEALETARSEALNRTEDYLVDVPLLADYLENGLEAMGFSVSDAEDDLY